VTEKLYQRQEPTKTNRRSDLCYRAQNELAVIIPPRAPRPPPPASPILPPRADFLCEIAPAERESKAHRLSIGSQWILEPHNHKGQTGRNTAQKETRGGRGTLRVSFRFVSFRSVFPNCAQSHGDPRNQEARTAKKKKRGFK
jgi:hypothetical protein